MQGSGRGAWRTHLGRVFTTWNSIYVRVTVCCQCDFRGIARMTQLLIVDDEPQFRNTLVNALKSQGYRATGIADTDALTPTLAIHRPDVILLDLNFDSGTNGIEACERLRH